MVLDAPELGADEKGEDCEHEDENDPDDLLGKDGNNECNQDDCGDQGKDPKR